LKQALETKFLCQLADNPLEYLGLNVNVTGHIESISNVYFYLVDVEEKYSLIVFYNNFENITIHPGQKVNISGKFTFDHFPYLCPQDFADITSRRRKI